MLRFLTQASVKAPLRIPAASALRGPAFAAVRAYSAGYPVDKNGKPMRSYIRFSNENRAKVIEQNPSLTIPEQGRELGRLWRELPESERQRYKDEYAQAMGKA